MPDLTLQGLDETSLKQLLMNALARGMSPEELAVEIIREKFNREAEEQRVITTAIEERQIRQGAKRK